MIDFLSFGTLAKLLSLYLMRSNDVGSIREFSFGRCLYMSSR